MNEVSQKAKKQQSSRSPGISKKGKKRSSKTNPRKFSHYIFKLMRHLDPTFAIGKKGMEVANTFLNDMIDRLGVEASNLSTKRQGKSLGWHEVRCAAKLVLPGELGIMSIREGERATLEYCRSSGQKTPKTADAIQEDEEEEEDNEE